ncbi:hypothetical protein KVR01_000923 [Diaporthe batatas]|uniref:uncharacterized protein n=1 Tax=Diaporthe batatas TaxID=748121 RepID=UPI001D03B426|nr:uncharacterized protein KVR01_000923 [Diaporthe batatas]KAG8170178.1 hypothetical protein KVR01_000923 [Diaporthe batatas]
MAPETDDTGPPSPDILLATLAEACLSGQGYGSMSPSIYDTAWLSMIEKPVGSGLWLFPDCFDYILRQQSDNGGWPSYSTVTDGILNTSAALLALITHQKRCRSDQVLESRCHKAQQALETLLDRWDVSACDQVGFEVLVTQHINLLAADGVAIKFPGKQHLDEVFHAKLKRLSSLQDFLYKRPCTLLHSLEAMIGHIDFDRIRCWREPSGSMMNSPSSTAAYLMHASEWDQAAEDYLRAALQQGPGRSTGCVPCAWPTTIFEVSWTVTTLVQAGIRIGEGDSSALRTVLERALSDGQGCVGFSPNSTVPDADDTAKTILALRYLGNKDFSIDPLLATFETEEHFLTYQGERNPSFSTNCNVLMCLGMLENALEYTSQITKTVKFLSDRIFAAQLTDKWNRSELYSMMLLSQALERLYGIDNESLLNKVSFQCPILFNESVPVATIQVLIKLVGSQGENGSWEDMCEPTAYAILALRSLVHLPWLRDGLELYGIKSCIDRGRSYLKESGHSEWVRGRHIWIEKLTYASPLLSEIYCHAALYISPPQPQGNDTPTPSLAQVLPNPTILAGMRKAGVLMARTPLLGPSQLEPSLLRAAELQAAYALGELQRHKRDVFPAPPRKHKTNGNGGVNDAARDRYLTFVPLTWTACAAVYGGKSVSLRVLYDMMVFSMLVYQADEYMEGVVEADLGTHLESVRELVRRVVGEELADAPRPLGQEQPLQPKNGVTTSNGTTTNAHPKALMDAEIVLRRFVSYVLRHPFVLGSPAHLRMRVTSEVEAFLLAHLQQAEDNRTLHASRQGGTHLSFTQTDEAGCGSRISANPWESAGGDSLKSGQTQENERVHPAKRSRTFYNWVRSTSADHTSCPCAFVFFNCLVTSSSPKASSVDLYGNSAKTAYVAEDLCRHLASMCRMYNDYASVVRDEIEGNLNSIAFAEFGSGQERIESDGSVEHKKAQLMWIAEYERRGMEAAMLELKGEVDSRSGLDQGIVDSTRLFVSVTDLYGQIYVIRDLTNRVKGGGTRK